MTFSYPGSLGAPVEYRLVWSLHLCNGFLVAFGEELETPTVWVRTNKTLRCPICKHDHWCTMTKEGTVVHCMRVKSNRPCKGGGWIHRLPAGSVFTAPLVVTAKPPPKIDAQAMCELFFEAGRRWREDLARALGVNAESLDALRVGYDEKLDCSVWPEVRDDGVAVGLLRRYRDGKKLMIRGSRRGLYVPDGMRRSGLVLIPEGGSDVAAALTAGHKAIGRPSCVGGADILSKLLRDWDGYIMVVAERDRKQGCCQSQNGCHRCWPGLWGAMEVAMKLEESLNRVVHVVLPPAPYKDLRVMFSAGVGIERLWRVL